MKEMEETVSLWILGHVFPLNQDLKLFISLVTKLGLSPYSVTYPRYLLLKYKIQELRGSDLFPFTAKLSNTDFTHRDPK